ncbi:MAG: hypothetical protein KatS3mg131_1160 [Candidatus Tectimicrobiota bacterium]|nr:MAG: hypothetical protein KatS3mg131_1160 [Candidatus Tectomicrobia bacterium]
MRRVVITGIGAVTAAGLGRRGLWQGVQRGQSPVRRLSRFDPAPYRSQVAAEVDLCVEDFLERRQCKRLDRFAQLALIAAQQALDDAGLRGARLPPQRTGIAMGSALGGITMAETQHQTFLQQGLRAVNPALALAVFGASSACTLAIELGLQGPVTANSNSCSAGTVAIGDAFRLIRQGHADVMLAGGGPRPP